MSPVNRVNVAIIGSGLSGITVAIELKDTLGIDTFTIYERGTDVGGTWRDNIYPNCASDVPSHWYSLSTELNPNWSQKYSPQPEIQKYWQAVAKKHNLAKHTQYGSNFLKATWMEADSEYICDFVDAAGEPFTVHCDVLISCIGGFSTPLAKPVGMKGIDSFKGPVFHSARWDYSIDLKGKKVGVIGNGCSAAQFIPVISEDKSVEVINFVRTPNYFMPRDQKTYSALTKTLFKYIPGYMRTYRNFIMATSDSRFIVWMLNAWGLRHYVEEVSLKYMRDTAPAKYHGFLTPRYPFGCKRVIMDPGYLAALNRSNVDMVSDGIATINAGGIEGVSGKQYDFDVLILGTGFDLSTGGLGLNVVGLDGKTISETWTASGGPQSYLGTTLANYPNYYSILGPNVASGSASVVYSTEAQVNYIVKMLEPMVKYGVKSFECKVEAEQRYNTEIQARLKGTVWNGGCKSYYKQGDKVIATYPGTTTEFWWRTRKPIWENYIQVGGTHRVGVVTRTRQLLKIIALVALALYVRKVGTKAIKRDMVIFLLMRYQDVMGFVESVRG